MKSCQHLSPGCAVSCFWTSVSLNMGSSSLMPLVRSSICSSLFIALWLLMVHVFGAAVAEDSGVYPVEHRAYDCGLHVQFRYRAETLHVGPFGYLVRHLSVVGEGLSRVLPQFQLGAFAHPSVVEVGDDEEPGFHPSAHGLSQTVDEHEETRGGGDGHQVVVERHDDDVRVDEHGYQSLRLQTAGRVHEHHVYAGVVMQLLHELGHGLLVVSFVGQHVVGYGIHAVFLDVGLAALQDGVLEIAVHDHDTHALRHEIVGEGDAEGRLADSPFLVGECHDDGCLYHFVHGRLVRCKSMHRIGR